MPIWMWVVAGIVLALIAFERFIRGRLIDGPTARALVGEGAFLIDTRTPAEYAAGHIPNATNIPYNRLSEHIDKLPARDRPIVLYCQSGARSGAAARMLRQNGFTAVYNLGSFRRW